MAAVDRLGNEVFGALHGRGEWLTPGAEGGNRRRVSAARAVGGYPARQRSPQQDLPPAIEKGIDGLVRFPQMPPLDQRGAAEAPHDPTAGLAQVVLVSEPLAGE